MDHNTIERVYKNRLDLLKVAHKKYLLTPARYQQLYGQLRYWRRKAHETDTPPPFPDLPEVIKRAYDEGHWL